MSGTTNCSPCTDCTIPPVGPVCPTPPVYTANVCPDTSPTDCVFYTGPDQPCLNIASSGTPLSLTAVLQNLFSYILTFWGRLTSKSLTIIPSGACNNNVAIEIVPSSQNGNILVLGNDGRPYVPQTIVTMQSSRCINWQSTGPAGNIVWVPVLDFTCVSSNIDINCAAPSGVAISNVTTTGAVITFGIVGGVTYDLLINNTVDQTGITSPFNITNLTPNTSYTAAIRVNCVGGSSSETVTSFTTQPILTCGSPSGLTISTLSGGGGMITNLIWTPAAGGGTQTIQFKPDNTSTWISYTTVGPTVSTQGITGLAFNTLYDIQVVNNCPTGSTASVSGNAIQFQCPNPSVVPADISAIVQFVGLGGTVDTYIITLLDATAANVLQTKTLSLPFNSTIQTTFTSLAALTSYNVKIVPSSGSYSKSDCPLIPFTTTNTPVCPAPVGLNISFS